MNQQLSITCDNCGKTFKVPSARIRGGLRRQLSVLWLGPNPNQNRSLGSAIETVRKALSLARKIRLQRPLKGSVSGHWPFFNAKATAIFKRRERGNFRRC